MLTFRLKRWVGWFVIFSSWVPLFPFIACGQEKGEVRVLRNPFVPLVTSDGRLISLDREKTKSDLVVEGTVFDKYGRSYAIVNSLVIEVGDSIDGFRVLKIEQGKVTLMKDGEIKVVEVPEFKEELKKEEER